MEANLPPTTPPPQTPSVDVDYSTPGDPYEKKFKIAAGIAGLLAIALIAVGFWGYSQKSDLDDANAKLAAESSTLGEDAAKLAVAKAAYDKVRSVLTKRDAEDVDLEAAVKKETTEYNEAEAELAAANSKTEKEAAQANADQQQLEAAQACAQGAVAAINKLFDEEAADSGVSGTISKLSSLETQCKAVIAQ